MLFRSCWDIGCGTGSVAVEMAYRCPDGHVYAYDKNAAAVLLTHENAQKFCCDHITAAEGECPTILQDAPAPDKVFIGGSGGNLREIFSVIQQKNPAADIAATAVSLETLSDAVQIFEQYCVNYQVTQIAVTRTKKRGAYTMFDAQNPVYLITGGLKCAGS